MQKKKQEKRQPARTGLLFRLLKGGVVAVAVSVALLAAMALLVSGGVLSRTTGDKSVAVACVLGALLGGQYALSRCERGFLLVSTGVGAVEWLLLLSVGVLCFGCFAGAGEMVGCAVACLSGGLLAGVVYALRCGGHRKRN